MLVQIYFYTFSFFYGKDKTHGRTSPDGKWSPPQMNPSNFRGATGTVLPSKSKEINAFFEGNHGVSAWK